jgi:hypothetical protein
MRETMVHHWLQEEEFLDGYSSPAWEASKFLKGEWEPNSRCDDAVRQNHKYFMDQGDLKVLVFESASVYHDDKTDKFSSVQIGWSLRVESSTFESKPSATKTTNAPRWSISRRR